MRSEIFKDHGFPDADYDFGAGRNSFNQPVVNFRAPGRGIQMIDLNRASQIKQKLAFSGDAEGSSLFDHLIKDAQRGLVTAAPLYVDASRQKPPHRGETRKTEDLGRCSHVPSSLAPTQNVVRRRNQCSPKPSNHFCNKICQKATSHLWFEMKRGRLVGDLFDPNLILMKWSYLKPIGNASFNNIHV